MNRAKNIKTNVQPNQHQDAQLPRVSISYWRYHGKAWRAYQLPNGAKFMSDRQMALLVGQPKNMVREFIESRSLETLILQVDNGKAVQVYPLSVAAIYLSTLLKDGDLDKHPLGISRGEWHSLIKALCKKEPGRESMPNPCFFTGDYRVEMASQIQLELGTNISIQILVLQSGEYYIEYQEGLKCIQHHTNWLVNYSPKKARTLSSLKISPDIVECQVRMQKGFQSMYSLSIKDWLSLWEYFAKQKNRYAIALLKACAKSGIDVLIARAIAESELSSWA
ncbi:MULTISPECIES: hypothetical protein [Calothrix]|uniref:Uncharacterized protein n=2 Tax=Calothrix TaxID=1186 RepID=A0ABR8ALV8_9CYAN|nr:MULTISPECIES: hypothetical protein [Calothrix]MBD2200535.1 hypothetical protein [Calothrix parietina FACHB-288]MBD2229573.1 hypothetical protein [Calothrix anomala FACHB-343]